MSNFPEDSSYPEAWTDEMQTTPGGDRFGDIQEVPTSVAEQYPHDMSTEPPVEDDLDWPSFLPRPRWFSLRHSSTHGRHVNRGQPLTGTSWLNRPYYVGGQLGAMWFSRSIDDNVSDDIDAFGGIFVGWDTDHYWGNELHIDWGTPEFLNSRAPYANRADSLVAWNYSLLYYPWGDSKVRPFWRAGIGSTHFEYPGEDGLGYDEWLITFPLGVGVKYPIKRWLAIRADVTDYISMNEDFPTLHNVAMTFALEWHFGVHPPSYWPWNPSRHIW